MRASFLVVAAALVLAGCGGTKTVTETQTVVHTTTVTVTTTPKPSTAANACTGDAMTGTFTVIAGSAGAGQIAYRLHVTNASPVACFVSGLPNVQLVGASGQDLPTNVIENGQATAAKVVLQPNASANADARFSPDIPGGSEPTDSPCEPKATTLRAAFGGAPLDISVSPPTPVCERGTLQFSVFTAG